MLAMASSRNIGKRRQRRRQQTFAAVSLALASSLPGIILADDYIQHEYYGDYMGGRRFEHTNQYRALRGETAWMEDVRHLSANLASSPYSTFEVQNLPEPWDDVPVQADGFLPLNEGESNTDNKASETMEFPPIKPRIVGGSEELDLDPFVMHLRYSLADGMWKFAGCGGSLISRCHILTAGHCMITDRSKAVYVNAWRPFSSNKDESTGSTKPYHVSLVDFEKTVTHPQFNNTGNLNDMAILTMETCIPDSRADLFEIMEVADDNFWQKMSNELLVSNIEENGSIKYLDSISYTSVAGFGQLDTSNPSVPPALQSVDVSLFGRRDCQERYTDKLLFSSVDLIQPDMYCAGVPEGGKDACLGKCGDGFGKNDSLMSFRTDGKTTNGNNVD